MCWRDILIALVLTIIILTAGCTGQTEDTDGLVLRIASPMEVKSQSVFGDDNLGVFYSISSPTLYRMNSDGRNVGFLARNCTVSDDKRVWTFYIEKDYYWTDGSKVTPEDIAFSIQTFGEQLPSARWIGDTLENVTFDDECITFTFTKPYNNLDFELGYPIISKKDWEGVADLYQYTSPGPYTGSGPFYLDSIDHLAGVLTFKRNPYWKGEIPAIDRIEVHTYRTIDAATLALERGDVDTYYNYADSYPYSGIESLNATGSFDFIETTDVGGIFLGMNLKKAPTNDLKFRKAIAYAIDYKEIVKIDALGYGEVPNYGFVPPTMEFYKDTPPLTYDPERAKKLLDAAGYIDSNNNNWREGKDGKELNLNILIQSDYTRVAELITDYFKQIGVKTTINTVDRNTWINLKFNYNYDLTVTKTTPWEMYIHANYGTGFFDSRRTTQDSLHYLDDPVFLDLCDKMLNSTDPATQREYAYQIQDYYAENLPGIALYWKKNVIPYNKALSGWEMDPLFGIFSVENFVSVHRVGA